MNIVFWILQALIAAAFGMHGVMLLFQRDKAQAQMKWIADMPNTLTTFVGAMEILGAVGLILPALTGILPWLTPLAAAGLALVMFLAIVLHLVRGEYPNIAFNFILGVLAAAVAYGRFIVVPV